MATTNASKLATAKNDVASDAVEIVEGVKDILEDSVEVVRASWIVRSNPRFLVGIASLSGLALGSALTYLVVSKRLSAKYQQQADEQIASVKDHYAAIHKTDAPSLEVLAAAYSQPVDDEETAAAKVMQNSILTEEGYRPYDKIEPATPETDAGDEDDLEVVPDPNIAPVQRNVFESDDADTYFVFVEEMAKREDRPDEPYVLTQDEFLTNESELPQQTLTYYQGDDTLADERDQPLIDQNMVVGDGNLYRFGHGSGDPKTVYIRNPRLGVEFEVSHSDGKFAHLVLGQETELAHSDRRPPRRMRPERD